MFLNNAIRQYHVHTKKKKHKMTRLYHRFLAQEQYTQGINEGKKSMWDVSGMQHLYLNKYKFFHI